MSEFEIASLSYQAITAWATVVYVGVATLTAGLIFYGIRTMSNSNNRRADAMNRRTEEISRADERRHEEAMATHREMMTALKEIMKNGEKTTKALDNTSKALMELLRRTDTDPSPTAPAGADRGPG